MDTGLVLIHFGEPPTPDPADVERYLTRIFLQNADLESADVSPRERAEELARRRAPGLIEEYERIGGSPLNAQARNQAEAVQVALADRGQDIAVEVAFQFFEPTIRDVLAEMEADGIEQLVLLPVYPICGPSTTVAALGRADDAITEMGWDPRITRISGWHREPRYLRLRARNIQQFAAAEGIDIADDDTTLLFSGHGTPRQYIDEGSPYVDYIEESCETIAGLLDIDAYALGYQNHENRDIPWTEPDVEDLLEDMTTDRVVVEPISFMHEQSETLFELDEELAEEAHTVGIDFRRVPIPHDHDVFPDILADLTQPALADIDPAMYQLRQCQCVPTENTYCLNSPASSR